MRSAVSGRPFPAAPIYPHMRAVGGQKPAVTGVAIAIPRAEAPKPKRPHSIPRITVGQALRAGLILAFCLGLAQLSHPARSQAGDAPTAFVGAR